MSKLTTPSNAMNASNEHNEVWLRPFATALLNETAFKRLEEEISKPISDVATVERLQAQIYDDEKQRCVEKYGDMVDVAYNFDLIFSVHIMQLYAEIQMARTALMNEADIRGAFLKERVMDVARKTDSICAELHAQMCEIKRECALCGKERARSAKRDVEVERLTEGYKMTIRELKSLDEMQWNVIVVQVYICIILAMLVAIGSSIVVGIGCEV